ncbi:uncharacterized protein CELE_ZK688.10 [Caenorhabditis elegans]|uniref:Transmembrane protein n=1 Tax=Caenorhabditis elegans TaxID=6239 RepID=Q3S1N8_CAEEL|nr:Transmembrane protein [Caenorhabditis elegans]CCD62544.1 Transmembrane protein [Caenorhabditis elegans]|eukprot:NP_001033389.2 Uncharacterized protein CELE_ZK688.10 [Caenorhabditis elegans]
MSSSMQADFNFNLPYRQQSLTRNPPRNYQHLPRVSSISHGCHVFCQECFSRIFLCSAAYKLYLLVAWCIGLSGLMYLQKPTPDPTQWISDELKAVWVGIFFVYLISQIFGLLAVVSEIEKIFVPYTVILIIIKVTNIIILSQTIVVIGANLFGVHDFGDSVFGIDPVVMCVLSILYLIYNSVCLLAVLHLCAHFDKKRIVAERRRRELIAQNNRIINRLIELNGQEQPVVIDVDSPPKYSSLTTKSGCTETPPPGYSQLDCMDDNWSQDGKK